MFTRLLGAPICSREVVIIVVGLPYKRRVCRLAHPYYQTCRIVPHLVVPGFVHTFHVLDIEQLCFFAKFFEACRLAIALVYRLTVIYRIGIRCFASEKVLVPHVIVVVLKLLIGRQRPQFVLGDK